MAPLPALMMPALIMPALMMPALMMPALIMPALIMPATAMAKLPEPDMAAPVPSATAKMRMRPDAGRERREDEHRAKSAKKAGKASGHDGLRKRRGCRCR